MRKYGCDGITYQMKGKSLGNASRLSCISGAISACCRFTESHHNAFACKLRSHLTINDTKVDLDNRR